MKKGIKITLIVLGVLIIGVPIGLLIMFRIAFGPSISNYEIENELGNLICKETYNADFAAVFYDVDFKLKNKESITYDLGTLYFQREDWKNLIELKEADKWYYINSNYSTISNLILTNKQDYKTYSFYLDTRKLKNDSIWEKPNNYNLELSYTSKFQIDSIIDNSVYVTYTYHNKKADKKNKSQKVEYLIDFRKEKLKVNYKSNLE